MNRRKKSKKNSDKMNSIIEIKVGDKVRLNAQKEQKGNLKRNEWIEKNKERVFTVEQGVLLNGKQTSTTIFQLKEDENEVKWLFTANELKRIN